nr:hypothetical protein CFP56_55675 [Quercus suber]
MVYGLHHFSLQVFVGLGVIIDSSGIPIMPNNKIVQKTGYSLALPIGANGQPVFSRLYFWGVTRGVGTWKEGERKKNDFWYGEFIVTGFQKKPEEY